MEEQKVVFDPQRKIGITLPTPDGPKRVEVRYPNDEEWIIRHAGRRVIVKQIGRGVTETDVPERNDDELALFKKIRLGDSPELSGAEAAMVIARLDRAEVDDVISETPGFRILLRVPGGIVTHVLKMPSAEQKQSYSREVVSRRELRNRQELSVNLRAASALYDKLCQGTVGYPETNGSGPFSNVPVNHKVAAVSAAIDALEAAFEDSEENF